MSKAKKEQKTVSGVFDSIFEQAEFVNAAGVATVVELPLSSLVVNPHQPRKHFSEEELAQLASSVAAHGVLQPIVVRELGMGRYEIVVGERRFRAAALAGLKAVPAIVRELDEQTTRVMALVENLQRSDLNPLEETDAFLNLLSTALGRPIPDVVAVLGEMYDEDRGRSRHSAVAGAEREQVERLFAELGRFTLNSFVTHRLPLLNLPEDVLVHVRQGSLNYTKALAVARLKGEGERADLLEKIASANLSLRAVQQVVASKLATLQGSAPERELAKQFSKIGKRMSSSAVMSDKRKRERVQKLLAQLEQLLE
jgi:ParB family chromosome partitioning protein